MFGAFGAFPVARNAFPGGDPRTPDVGDSVPHPLRAGLG
jgi:hypothetical protein